MKANRIIRHVTIALLALLLFLPLSLQAKNVIRTGYGVVEKVSDGDSIQVVSDNGTRPKIRLYGIDAPEIAKGSNGVIREQGQPFGEEAQNALEHKVMGKKVRIDILDTDRYLAWFPSSILATETSIRSWFKRDTPGPTRNI